MNILSNTHSTKCSRRWRTQNYRMHSNVRDDRKTELHIRRFLFFFYFFISTVRASFQLVSLSLSLFRKSVVRKSMILPYCVNVNNDLYIFFRLPSHSSSIFAFSSSLLSCLLLPSFPNVSYTRDKRSTLERTL